tara:strand:+ start:688 stop:1416 length:729 start_codon:yes stop_codon:yes gene_type:complete
MAVPLAIPLVMAGVGIATGVIGLFKAKSQREDAEAAAEQAKKEITMFENGRDAVINPYAGAVSQADMITDLSDNLTNPFNNLGVATQAAEIQMEQTDIALANTLDTLQATGASAGGATALAQAAARSKKDVSASIETQEAANEKARATGEQNLQQRQLQEQQRVQQGKVAEEGRVQGLQGQGLAIQQGAKEERNFATLGRLQGQENQARQDISDANAAFNSSLGNITSGLMSGAASLGGKVD